MTFVGLDTETDASPSQRFVCASIYQAGQSTVEVTPDRIRWLLRDPQIHLVLHNAAFDVGVLTRAFPEMGPLWTAALEADRVWCTQIRESLIGIAAPSDMQFIMGPGFKMTKRAFNLDGLLQRYLGQPPMDKGADGWRLRFGELQGLPLAAWPQRALDYAMGDVEHLEALLRAQKAAFGHPDMIGSLRVSPDEAHQVRASVALEAMASHGMAHNDAQVARLRTQLEAEVLTHVADLLAAGLMRAKVKKRPDELSMNKKMCQAAVEQGCELIGIKVPLTPPSKMYPLGQVSTSKETLEMLADATPVLRTYHQKTHCTKMIQTYLRPVEAAAALGEPVRPRYHTLKETGRTSASGPNVQNLPRLAGMREIYVARPGHALIACDYDTAELRALGQVGLELFGHSKFADFYNADPNGDPHCLFASKLAGIDYETMRAAHQAGTMSDEWDQLRASAKGVNFGAPGGLGAKALVSYLKGYGVTVDENQAQELLKEWKATWEMKPYFDWVNASPATVQQVKSGRIRGGTSFCSRANTTFQGLIADAAKEALWLAHTTRRATWFPWAFIHDEIILEVPLEDVHEASIWLEACMVTGARRWVTDVPMTAGSHAMYSWSKKAKRVLDCKARLIPDPKTQAAHDL